ncbi:MAG: hypothetical protein H7196_00915 [candidate division SR1 bacterium]|nr:hypothetical protein [candidate division SR1 bacterium]
MAAPKSNVKDKVLKNLQKTKGKIRVLKNIINKPRNDFPEFLSEETFVLTDGTDILLKLMKKNGKILVSDKMERDIKNVKVVNLFSGFDIWTDAENQDDIKLFQVSKDDVEICRITIGGGVIASIKKSNLSATLEAWIEA